MGGGSAGTTIYEPERKGVSKRRYGEVAKDGIQSQEQYDYFKSLYKGGKGNAKGQRDFYKTYSVVDAANELAGGTPQAASMFMNDAVLTANGFEKVKGGDGISYRKLDSKAYKEYTQSLQGAKYDPMWRRWTLGSGVDMEAAFKDWDNYLMEQQEIKEYEAKEERRKSAPDDLTGTSGKVDYTLADKTKAKKDESSVGSLSIVDESKSVASSSQELGIY